MDSTIEHAGRRGSLGTPQTHMSSNYLVERLEQRRANAARSRRSRHTDFGPRIHSGADDDIFLNEAEEDARKERALLGNSVASLPGANAVVANRTAAAARRRESLGVRIMDEKMDRLSKDNFNLKMEVDQRRQHAAKLQEQIDEMTAKFEGFERLQAEHSELWRINDALVKELEKRDRAVEEAIDTICDLEDKVTELEDVNSTGSTTRPLTAQTDSGYAGTETHEHAAHMVPSKGGNSLQTPRPTHRRPGSATTSVVSNKPHGTAAAQTPARARREPSVLSLKKPSTQALRSVYLDNSQSLNGVKSFLSLLKEKDSAIDEDEEQPLNSPRLSVLSASSFPSIYSAKKPPIQSPARHERQSNQALPQHNSFDQLRETSAKRTSQWISDVQAPMHDNASRKNSASSDRTEREVIAASPSRRPGDVAKFRSIADSLSTATTMQAHDEGPLPYHELPKAHRQTRQSRNQPGPTVFAGPIFGESTAPTLPDTISARMLRESRSTVADDRTRVGRGSQSMTKSSSTTLHERIVPKQAQSSLELKNAYQIYIQQRSNEHAIEDDDMADIDARSETVHDLSMDYDGFPDGQSIIMGTPSRFLRHGKPPGSTFITTPPQPQHSFTPVIRDHTAFNSFPHSPEAAAARRPQSSAGFTLANISATTTTTNNNNNNNIINNNNSKTPRKPSFTRADTSPSYLGGTMGRLFRRMSNSSPRRRGK